MAPPVMYPTICPMNCSSLCMSTAVVMSRSFRRTVTARSALRQRALHERQGFRGQRSARSAAGDELPRSHAGEVAALLRDLAGRDRVAVATGWTAEARPPTGKVVDELFLI